MNLEDIARKAGVSRSTVSRVINGENHVSRRTRQRVLQVIEQEGYHPNLAARMLVTRRSQIIGVVIPGIGGFSFDDSFYFPSLLGGVSEITHARDYSMLLWMDAEPREQVRFAQRIIGNRLMDGIVLSSAAMDNPLIEAFLKAGIVFVMTERPADNQQAISYVTIDNVRAAQEAVAHLIRLGRRRIATITGTLSNPDATDRLEGYRRAHAAAGLPVDERLIQSGDFNFGGSQQAMQQLLPLKPDAVFAQTDQMAIAALQVIQTAGYYVPEDIAMVGFDDIPTAQTHLPRLTTVHQPVHAKGHHAAELLIDLIEGRITGPQQIILPTELVIRETCGAANAAP